MERHQKLSQLKIRTAHSPRYRPRPFQRIFPNTGFSRTLDKNAPLIVIDVANTSDAELKRLGGWNYNINPYTLQLVQYERYNTI